MTTTAVNLENLQEIIESLRIAAPKIRSVIVARNDGLPLVQTASQDDPARMAAMTSTAVSLNKRIISTIEAGDLTETSISGTGGQILLYAAGPKAVLAIIAESKANAALINHKARAAAQAIASTFASSR
jgi:predicted regulator of Ras-like GTPase activity (Roadblock/LC7/MglB family)